MQKPMPTLKNCLKILTGKVLTLAVTTLSS
jgi:hypothetical protein